jgi:hypothetical protein
MSLMPWQRGSTSVTSFQADPSEEVASHEIPGAGLDHSTATDGTKRIVIHDGSPDSFIHELQKLLVMHRAETSWPNQR